LDLATSDLKCVMKLDPDSLTWTPLSPSTVKEANGE